MTKTQEKSMQILATYTATYNLNKILNNTYKSNQMHNSYYCNKHKKSINQSIPSQTAQSM